MNDYNELSYPELKKECAAREGINARGNAAALIEKLVNFDLGNIPKLAPKKPVPKGLKATSPNPENPNYDMMGRWIRRTGDTRPDGKVCVGGWSDENVVN